MRCWATWRIAIHAQQPPIPAQVKTPDGTTLFTGDDVMAGQHLFQKYGLMQFGTIFGHGAYLGPDFTAQYLHRGRPSTCCEFYRAGAVTDAGGEGAGGGRSSRRTATTPASGVLTFTPGQAYAFEQMEGFYRDWFGPAAAAGGAAAAAHCGPGGDPPADELLRLGGLGGGGRSGPGTDYSYTNNWPPEPLAGNAPTAEAFLWSVLSLIALLGGTGIDPVRLRPLRPAGLAPRRGGGAGAASCSSARRKRCG